MTTKTIGELPTAPAIPGSTMFEVEIDGVSRRLTLDEVKGALLSGYVPTATDPTVVEAVRQAAEEIALIKESIGSAVSAFESAKQAEEIRKLTVVARGVAEQASMAASTAKEQASEAATEAAEKAKDAAVFAEGTAGYAATASGAATVATQKADAAGESASIASASAKAASSSAGEASVRAGEAASSATDALGYRNQASTYVEVIATTAGDVAGAVLSEGRDPGASPSNWAVNLFNSLAVGGSNFAAFPALSIVNSKVRVADQSLHIHPRKAKTLIKGRRYEVSATFRRVVDGPAVNQFTLYCTFWNAEGQLLYGNTVAMNVLVDLSVATGTVTISREFVADGDNSGAIIARPMFRTPEGGTTELTDLGIRDVQEASAAATSASTASTKATEAETSATAANQSKVAAETAAGSAKSDAAASQQSAATASDKAAAATSAAGLSAGYRDQAEGFAATADERAAAASASAASASSSAELAASVSSSSGVYLNHHATFSDWPDSRGSLPGGWGRGVYDAGAQERRVIGVVGRYAYEATWPGGAGGHFLAVTGSSYFNDPGAEPDYGLRSGPGWYVVEFDVTLVAGDFYGAGYYLAAYNDLNQSPFQALDEFPNVLDASGNAPGAGVVGRRYRFAAMFEINYPITYLRFHPMTAWQGFRAAPSAKTLQWNLAGVRRAQPEEIANRKARVTDLPAVSARVKTTEDAIADLPNKYAGAQRVSTLEAQLANTADSGLRTGLAARIEDRATAIADDKAGAVAQTVSQLRAEYNGTAATVSQQAGAIVDLKGRTGAYWGVTVDDGQGPVEITAFAGANGRGVRIGGNLYVKGDVLVDGSVVASKFNAGSMSRDGRIPWSGTAAPDVGQTINLPGLGLPAIPPQGRFFYELRTTVATNAGSRTVTNMNGKPAYLNYLDDGGLRIRAVDGQGNVYQPRANSNDPVIATTNFSPNFAVTISRGSTDTGWTDQGDYYQRFMSATYTVTSYDLRVTWIAV